MLMGIYSCILNFWFLPLQNLLEFRREDIHTAAEKDPWVECSQIAQNFKVDKWAGVLTLVL